MKNLPNTLATKRFKKTMQSVIWSTILLSLNLTADLATENEKSFPRLTVSKPTVQWTCPSESDNETQILLLPEAPVTGKPLRVLALTRQLKKTIELYVVGPDGKQVNPDRLEAWGRVPHAVNAYFENPKAGRYKSALLKVGDRKEAVSCFSFTVSRLHANRDEDAPKSGIWQTRRNWDEKMEDLFSAFVAKLFYVPPGSKKGWRSLHQPTQDPFRNILYGVLGLDEDNPKADLSVQLLADCADAPFQIRAYFAWKMGLPFKFNRCNRANPITGCKCRSSKTNETQILDDIEHPVSRFNSFAKALLGWEMHSGNALTAPEADDTDLYPIKLNNSTIRPGVVFVDSGGHLIMVTQWDPQSSSSMGVLYGVDAHPDKTVTHKSFGAGTFVFNGNALTDGFKAFRPVTKTLDGLRFISNEALDKNSGFLPFSEEQASIRDPEQFYDAVYGLLNPNPVKPRDVLLNKIEVLHRAILERVAAVQLGVEYMNKKDWSVMSMPNGPDIFQTEGPWEIYSTPARDLRCFLALDDVMKFPAQVIARPSIYNIDPKQTKDQLLEELITLRDNSLNSRTIQYTRSDSSYWTLSLKEVIARRKALEMAYNPNDCPEARWAAPRKSKEFSTCRKNAPHKQTRKMHEFRHWFASRRRPDQR
jgi:hypothetical protein